MPTVGIAIVALLVGAGAAYLVWGAGAQRVEGELSQVKARLAEAQQAAVREGAMATKVQELEAQIKSAAEALKTEQEARAKLEAVAAKQKK
jgi:Tfp pilus assembly protein FimT